jgi:hypothetical protein
MKVKRLEDGKLVRYKYVLCVCACARARVCACGSAVVASTLPDPINVRMEYVAKWSALHWYSLKFCGKNSDMWV